MPDEHGFPTFDEWFEDLPSADQQRARSLTDLLREAGAHEPESWAQSEISENFAQGARFAFLRAVWRSLDRWRDPAHLEQYLATIDPANREAVTRSLRQVAFDSTFDVIMVIDDGEDVEAEVELPGWRLIEVGDDGELTGREVDALHESLLEVDPLNLEAEDLRGD